MIELALSSVTGFTSIAICFLGIALFACLFVIIAITGYGTERFPRLLSGHKAAKGNKAGCGW